MDAGRGAFVALRSSFTIACGGSGMAKIDRLLKFAVDNKASDLHISVGAEPTLRLHGRLRKVKWPVLTPEATHEMLMEILDENQRGLFKQHNSVDLCYGVEGLGRFRTNIYRQRLGECGVFRVLPSRVPSLEELGMPPVLQTLLAYRQGLILVTGPAGSGKTTTLAAMIDYLNERRLEHIITVEDPIEIVHGNKSCIMNQREVHRHTEGFGVALRAALREDPDIILVGEMRDLETISMAITSAETGHLVLGTLHTATAARTINRLVDVFPPEQMSQIRAMVSESIRGVISQQLIPRQDGKGRVAALEIMVCTPAIANKIRENQTFQIPSLMQIGIKQGMRLMDESLAALTRDGTISLQEFRERCENKTEGQKVAREIERSLRAAAAPPDQPEAEPPKDKPAE